MKKPVLTAAVMLTFLGILVVWFSITPMYRDARSISRDAKTLKDAQDRLTALAEKKGAMYAFEVLKLVELPPSFDFHLLGHVVGDELYKQKGIAGMADCTQDFRNACSHSIVIGAFVEFGEAALPAIRDVCEEAPGGSGAYTMCFHGMGHGVFAFYGYSFPETVEYCKKTGTEERASREYAECVGGAVMELMGGGGHDREKWLAARVKYLSKDNPLFPCMNDALMPDDAAKQICLMYLTPQLWEYAGIDLGEPQSSKFPASLAFCERIPHSRQNLRDACFGGFGKEFVPFAGGRDIRKISDISDVGFTLAIEWCKQATSEDGIQACVLEGLASVFWGGENDPDAAFRYCGLVTGVPQRSCYERLAENIKTYVSEKERRDQLCARIPIEARGSCDA